MPRELKRKTTSSDHRRSKATQNIGSTLPIGLPWNSLKNLLSNCNAGAEDENQKQLVGNENKCGILESQFAGLVLEKKIPPEGHCRDRRDIYDTRTMSGTLRGTVRKKKLLIHAFRKTPRMCRVVTNSKWCDCLRAMQQLPCYASIMARIEKNIEVWLR